MDTVQYADVAEDLARARQKGDQLLVRIREAAAYLKREHGYTVVLLAEVTGVHKNSMLKLRDATWIPNIDTLQKLEGLLVRQEAKRAGQIFTGENVRRGRPPIARAPVSRKETGSRAGTIDPARPRKGARRKVN